MPKADQTSKDRDAQVQRFQEAARELDCDDDPGRFDERLKRLARVPKPVKPDK